MTAALQTAASAEGARSRRTAADWLGFVFFCAFATGLALDSGKAGVLLVPPLFYELCVAITFLIRGRARRVLTGKVPRLAAYGASFLLPVFVWASVRWAPTWVAPSQSSLLTIAGASCWLFGSLVAFWPIWYLRRSFS